MRCAFCDCQFEVYQGRLPRHTSNGRPCTGSAQAVSPEAFGRVRGRVPMGGTTCIACGHRVEMMTVHDTVHAVWPCGDAFPCERADAVVLSLRRDPDRAPADLTGT